MKRFAIPAPDELHRQAKAKAASDGISLTTVICRLVCGWLNGEIELPECGEPDDVEDGSWSDIVGQAFIDHVTDPDSSSAVIVESIDRHGDYHE